jgi:tetratricopeptide (TPR) repeat protein
VQAVTAGSTALLRAQAFPTRLEWAQTQSHLGNALSLLGMRRAGTAELGQAVAAYRSALEEYTRRRSEMPLEWAGVQRQLAKTLFLLGLRAKDPASLHGAVAAFRAALEGYSLERHPQEWASTQNDLGIALGHLNALNDGTTYLDEAVAAYEAAQSGWTRIGDRANWAVSQNNKASVLMLLGQAETGTAGLERAADAYRAAMEAAGTDIDHATAENGLGVVLRMIAIRSGDWQRFEEAIAAHRSALTVYPLGDPTRHSPARRATVMNDLGRSLFELGWRTNRDELVNEAIGAFVYAAREFAQERSYYGFSWALAEINLGEALLARSARFTDTGDLEAALTAYRNALEEYPRQRYPADFAWAQFNIGRILVEIGRRRMLSDPVRDGKAALQLSWDAYEQAGHTDYDASFTDRLAEADRLIDIIDNGERAGVPK